jgi:hypothetical protein
MGIIAFHLRLVSVHAVERLQSPQNNFTHFGENCPPESNFCWPKHPNNQALK